MSINCPKIGRTNAQVVVAHGIISSLPWGVRETRSLCAQISTFDILRCHQQHNAACFSWSLDKSGFFGLVITTSQRINAVIVCKLTATREIDWKRKKERHSLIRFIYNYTCCHVNYFQIPNRESIYRFL